MIGSRKSDDELLQNTLFSVLHTPPIGVRHQPDDLAHA